MQIKLNALERLHKVQDKKKRKEEEAIELGESETIIKKMGGDEGIIKNIA